MIHYHGTPVSGPDAFKGEFLRGRHALVSFANPADLAIVMDKCQSFVLDNGAFSLWSKGGDVDVKAYRNWVMGAALHPGLDWCLIPDKIDGTEQQNRDLRNQWMDDALPVEGVPIWHLHESLEWLDELVQEHRTVALGSSGKWSSPGTDSWWLRMGEALSVACDSHGRSRARLHGLRMLDPEIFRFLPLASADSCNAAVNAGAVRRFGMYPNPKAAQRAVDIADGIEFFNSAPVWIGAQQRLIA